MSTTDNSTMLISLTFTFGPSGGRDKAITKELCDKYGATDTALTGNKRTFCKEATAPLRMLASEWKHRMLGFCHPWDVPSMYLCKPMAIATAIVLRDEYTPALNLLKKVHLLDRLDEWKELTKSQLRGAYKEHEFPTYAQLEEAVGWNMGIMALPDSEAMRRIKALGGDAIMDALTASHDARVQRGVNAAMVTAYANLVDPISEMVKLLASEETGIRDKLIGKLLTVANNTESINLTNDPMLTQLAAGTRQLFEGLNKEKLKANPVLRQSTVDAAKAMLAQFGAVGVRKFAA